MTKYFPLLLILIYSHQIRAQVETKDLKDNSIKTIKEYSYKINNDSRQLSKSKISEINMHGSMIKTTEIDSLNQTLIQIYDYNKNGDTVYHDTHFEKMENLESSIDFFYNKKGLLQEKSSIVFSAYFDLETDKLLTNLKDTIKNKDYHSYNNNHQIKRINHHSNLWGFEVLSIQSKRDRINLRDKPELIATTFFYYNKNKQIEKVIYEAQGAPDYIVKDIRYNYDDENNLLGSIENYNQNGGWTKIKTYDKNEKLIKIQFRSFTICSHYDSNFIYDESGKLTQSSTNYIANCGFPKGSFSHNYKEDTTVASFHEYNNKNLINKIVHYKTKSKSKIGETLYEYEYH